MKRTLALLAVLALAVPSMAEIQLFWSTTGINDPNYVYSTALTNFLPWFVPPTPVSQVYDPNNPTGMFDLFLWGKFIENNDPNSPNYLPAHTHIYGIDLKFEGDGTVGQNVAYAHYKTTPPPYRRWFGPQGTPLNSAMGGTRGIEFLLPPDTNGDLYYPETQEFLVGAAQVTLTWGQTKIMSLDASLDGLGIAMRYIDGDDIPDPRVLPAEVVYAPEPASLIALALVGVLMRRR